MGGVSFYIMFCDLIKRNSFSALPLFYDLLSLWQLYWLRFRDRVRWRLSLKYAEIINYVYIRAI